jgi:predicted CxxxxCH...CXXCH cytochrome family protein
MATHVNGVIDVASMSCTACHGTAGRTGVTGADANVAAAPPIATLGHDTAVGAHQPHVNQGATAPPLSAPFACPVCHSGVVPTAAPHGVPASPVVFGGLAITGSAAAGYVKATQNCSSTYCHGNFTGGNGATTVTWGTAGKLTCTGCHGTPPTATDPAHPADTNCGLCHTGYTISAVNPTTHVNGLVDVVGGGDCVGCHTTAQTMAAGGTRRAIVPEFALAWSHKRSAAGVVTKWDCIVCHMEGDASGNPSAVHRDGVIDLRDPDTGTTIQGVTWGGTGAGAYTSTGTALTFARFSRDLGNATLEPAVQAIMINQCLKCHDVDGAVSLLARVPTGTAEKPFGTTIAGAGYTGAGVTAAGVAGGVTDVSNSFSTANASYHPVLGKANNSYVSNSRMSAPWNALSPDKTAGTTTSWGYLISCWDCHAPAGATGVQTSTVTAHGGAATLRGNIWANPAALCKTCHIAYTSGSAHGVGSAFNSSVNSGMNTYIQNQCHYCHSSGVTRPTRPQPAQDVHGFDLFAPTAGAGDTMWPAGTANTYKPYAFMRSVGSALGGRWTSTSWKPLSGPGVPTGSATCGGSMSTCSGENMSGYSPGGTY